MTSNDKKQTFWPNQIYLGSSWFGLVSLFNGISTFFSLFNAKAILIEEQ